jgi:hypothetical protein
MMSKTEQRERIMVLLKQRIDERPDLPIVHAITQLAYAGAGHTGLGEMSDKEFLAGLEHGYGDL